MKTNKNATTKKARLDKNNAFKILRFLKPYTPLLVLSLLLITAQIIATLFVPVIIGNAIDRMLGVGNVDFDYIAKCFIYIGICIIIVMVCQFLSTLLTNAASHKTVRDIRNAAFTKINKVPLSYIDSTPHGEIMNRIVLDTDMISEGLIQSFTQGYSGIVTVITTIIFMLTLNLTVTLVVVVITPLSIAVAVIIGKFTNKMFKTQAAERGKMTALTQEMLSGARVIKAFNYEGEAEKKFDKINEDLKICGIKAMFYSSTSNPTTRFVNGIIYASVCVIGAFLAVSSPLTFSVGALSCFLAYANQYTKPFNEITGVISELQSSFAAAGRVLALLNETEELDDGGLKPLSYIDGCVEAENVSFSYVKDRPLISNFNLNVLPGQRVAIVGPTGCGKTTLINLLMRFYDTDSGNICVSNQNIREVTRSSLRRCYGMVLQDSWLFNGSVRENIAYGKEDATDKEIEDAAKSAYIHNFIIRLPNGYDTILDGDSISQGQKQLLTLARIMLTKPPMLILDEATSSIDTRTEIKIQAAFSEMMRGRTSFIIAHRLSTIKDADLILVMKDGNVIESGNHETLLAEGGFYSQLYNSQFAPTN